MRSDRVGRQRYHITVVPKPDTVAEKLVPDLGNSFRPGQQKPSTVFFFFNAPAPPEIYALPPPAPLPILGGWVGIRSWPPVPAVIVIVPEVAAVRPVALKLSVRSPAAPVIARFVKLATPLPFVVAVSE